VLLDGHECTFGEIIGDHGKRALEQVIDDLDLGGGDQGAITAWRSLASHAPYLAA
jgi:hypothetical protein